MKLEDYDFTYVQRPFYVLWDTQGGIAELFCKVCGTRIAGYVERLVDIRQEPNGVRVEVKSLRFTRTEEYVEAKFEFWDGSFHVTNGCRNCVHTKLTSDQMYEIHIADLLNDGGSHTELAKVRVPRKVVIVRKDGGGIE